MHSAAAANNLVSNSLLAKYKLRAFIPAYRTSRTGIIKNVSTDIEIGTLEKYLESPAKIIEIERLNRRIRVDNDLKSVPSNSISIKFAGQNMPDFVYLFKPRYEVTPFIPKTRICYSCFRIGHVSNSCRSKKRCIYCGKEGHPSGMICPAKELPPICINCGGGHIPTSQECPHITEHRMAQAYAATNSISFIEAKQTIANKKGPVPDRFVDLRIDINNFPLFNSYIPLGNLTGDCLPSPGVFYAGAVGRSTNSAELAHPLSFY